VNRKSRLKLASIEDAVARIARRASVRGVERVNLSQALFRAWRKRSLLFGQFPSTTIPSWMATRSGCQICRPMDACRFPAAPQQAIRFKVRCRRAPRGQELWSKFEGCGLQAILPSRNERLWNDRFWRKADIRDTWMSASAIRGSFTMS
jgi:hypothetical protein